MPFSEYTAKSVNDVFSVLTTTEAGLSSGEVAVRQKQYGRNELTAHEITWRDILWRQFKSSFIYLLLAAGVISMLLGEIIDGVLIFLFVVINAGLGFYQEWHSERALRMLQKLVTARAAVRRDGQVKIVPSGELVPGDVVTVRAGDIVAADMRLIEAEDLVVNESSLSGESAPGEKNTMALPQPVSDLYKAANILFTGTAVASGQGVGVVFGTGNSTVIGEIGKLAVETKKASSFEREIGDFSRFILRMTVITIIAIFLANLMIKGRSANPLEFLIFSVALAVSVIPEALPVVTTLAMSRGALRLAKNKVVVKRLSAIEDLGSIEVLCTDKTGTITENELTVTDVQSTDRDACLLAAIAGSTAAEETEKQINNAFDRAVWNALTPDQRQAASTKRLVNSIPFDPERRRTTAVVQEGDEFALISRGAPEMILGLCAMPDNEKQSVLAAVRQAGQRGQRVLAVARTTSHTAPSEDSIKHESGLTWQGMIAFADPLKPTAMPAIVRAKELGVQVKILTGDSIEVAGTVGAQVHLIDDPAAVMSGSDFAALSHPEQKIAIEKFHVFARLTPQQKHRIIELLERQHHVGFLGEGINDAPALKAANVSLVVDSASDIARQNADVILLQQNLDVIILGIQQGREVFSNTVKYIKATLLSNFGNFYAVAIASLLIPYLPMLPIQLLLLNLLSDFPMITIATDTVDVQELRRPKTYQVREIVLVATILGVVSTVFDFIFFAVFSRISPEALQTNWFIGSVLTELVVIYSIRTRFVFWRGRRPSAPMLWLTAVAAVVTLLLPISSIGQNIFHFTPPTGTHMVWIAMIVLGYLVVTECVKHIYYRFIQRAGRPALKPVT